MITTTRRSLITGLISLIAAPAIIRAGSLMPVKIMTPLPSPFFEFRRQARIGDILTTIAINNFDKQPVYTPKGLRLETGSIMAGEVIAIVYDGYKWVKI